MSSDDHPVLFRRAGSTIQRPLARDFAKRLRDEVTEGKSFSCLITDDRELQRLNRQFLGKDYPTDVLSFPAASDGLGDIAISCQRAAAQAREFGHTVDQELRVLMLHGVLHLMGMDHEKDRGAMAKVEKRWRKALGLPSSLIERVKK